MIPHEASVASQTTTIGGGLIVFGHATLPPYPSGSQRQQLMAPSKQSESSSDEPLSSNKSGLQSSPPGFFLRTKLLPPRPAPQLLSRPRLTDRLLANLGYPLTLVTANAGSGKTTLVADFLRTHERQFVWYQLDRSDTDPFVFLGYLSFGIQQVIPGFGNALFAYLKEASSELAQNPERVVDVLINEVLERVEQQ